MTSTVRLYRTELRRIALRRSTRAAALLLTALILFTAVRTFTTSSDEAADLARAEAIAAESTASCRQDLDGELSGQELDDVCYADPAWFVDDPAYHLQSLLAGDGTRSWATVRRDAVERSTYEYADGVERENPATGFSGDLVSVMTLATLVGALLAATWIGADWRSGVAESQVVWVPDRRRLAAAKLAAVATAAALLAIAAGLLEIGASVPSAIWRGDLSGTGTGFWVDVVATVGRGAVATAILAVLAGSVALALRNTVAGMVIIFGASFVVALLAAATGRWPAFLSPGANVDAFVRQADMTFLERHVLPGGGNETFSSVSHSWLAAGGVAAVFMTGCLLVGNVAFARRDIS